MEYKRLLTKLKFMNLYDDLSISLFGEDIVIKNWRHDSEKEHLFLPYGFTALDAGCFSGSNLKVVELCDSITKVGYGCFANCLSLEKIILHRSQEHLEPLLRTSNNAVFVYKENLIISRA